MTGNNFGGSIAPNACDTDNVLWAQLGNGRVFWTTNATSSSINWSVIPQSAFSGAPATGELGWGSTAAQHYSRRHILVADKVNCDTFYIYNSETPGLYKSTDKGATWSLVFSGKITNDYGYRRIQSVPGRAGWLYLSSGMGPRTPVAAAGYNPMWSRDGGVTWAACPALGEPFDFSLGAPKPGGPGNPAVFAIGFVGTAFGIYRSDDDCQTWSFLGSQAQPSGDVWFQYPLAISGDMNVYGKVYVGMAQGSGYVQGTLQ
jgi:hypothetical protein